MPTTPAGPTSATSPTVDEDLLRDIGSALDDVFVDRHAMADHPIMGAKLLSSEPMIRLFSIWTATVAAQRDQYADQWEAAQRERDEARSEVQQFRYAQDYEMKQKEAAYTENDTLSAEVERLRAQVADLVAAGSDLDVLRYERDEARRQAAGLRNQHTRALFDSDRANRERERAAVPDLPDATKAGLRRAFHSIDLA